MMTSTNAAAELSVARALGPLMAVVLVAFVVIGLALPVLPLHVNQRLGLGTFVVGLVTGSQFVASLISRVWAGNYSDRKGAKRGVIIGLCAAAVSGVLYFASLGFLSTPTISVTILVAGRALLGAAESFIITGAVTWGLALVGTKTSGKVIAWGGMAMFAALAAGAPLGTWIYNVGGFAAVALGTTAVPIMALGFVALLPAVSPRPGAGSGWGRVAGAVWLPGLGAALSSIGYGAILAFGSLLFVERAWHPVWLAFTAYAAALIVARLFLGDLPDKLGGARIALWFVAVEVAGLVLIWAAVGPLTAAIGAALTGFGYSLVYPGLGAEAVRRAPVESHGLAMGMYTACLDVALGLGTPALGLLAGWTRVGPVYLASALIVLGAAPVAARLLASEGGLRRSFCRTHRTVCCPKRIARQAAVNRRIHAEAGSRGRRMLYLISGAFVITLG